eukprot:CAMPEP_0203831450 /NCGR_PEP_ID=MMETSP0115-20131106/68347_1 /ASSEMBLY_ACC=CAM_ASM_000227 /TAXON_ID=33651 /ORGANISM="Bicosoecid sp, Strain ms1" /LENGTH=52 /DNA_ID=CAMNT_0050740513 /DNA_START=85 /DNA_END=240 /DNA_ORIENTATION=-
MALAVGIGALIGYAALAALAAAVGWLLLNIFREATSPLRAVPGPPRKFHPLG